MDDNTSILTYMGQFMDQQAFVDKIEAEGKGTEVRLLTLKLSNLLMPIAIEFLLNKKQNQNKGWV